MSLFPVAVGAIPLWKFFELVNAARKLFFTTLSRKNEQITERAERWGRADFPGRASLPFRRRGLIEANILKPERLRSAGLG
jgi:hypothetical protein